MTGLGKEKPKKLPKTLERNKSSANKQSPVGAIALFVQTPCIHIFPDPHDVPSAAPPLIIKYMWFMKIVDLIKLLLPYKTEHPFDVRQDK